MLLPSTYLLFGVSHWFIHSFGCFVALMGTEFARACVKEENMEIPSIPPGFESLAPFSLKKVGGKELKTNYSTPVTSSVTHMVTESDNSEDSKVVKRRRACVHYGQLENSSGDDSNPEQVVIYINTLKICV